MLVLHCTSYYESYRVCDKCLVKMEKILYTIRDFERDYIHITFAIIFCYNLSILLFVFCCTLLQCLIYKLNSVTGMCVWGGKKNNIYRVWYY